MKSKNKLVSLVIPFLDECEGVDVLHKALSDVFETIPDTDFEVVCIDDGSTDGTLEKLIDLAARDDRFCVIELSRNFGKEAALTAGIDHARGDAIIPFDADLQDPPALIPQMIEAWRGGADVVLARRSDRRSDSFLKRNTAKLFYRIHNQLSNVDIPENVGDFRLIDRMVVDQLKKMPERQKFMKGLFAWVGFRAVTLDYTRQQRTTNTTKFSGWKLWNFALEGITSFSSAPLKIWTYLGMIGAVITFLYAAITIMKTLLYGVDVPGYASLLVAVLFFGSLQMVGIGLLGEYIGRIYMETKQRPAYIVRKRYDGGDNG